MRNIHFESRLRDGCQLVTLLAAFFCVTVASASDQNTRAIVAAAEPWLVAIGVDSFEHHPNRALQFCVTDAVAICAELTQKGGLIRPEHAILLTSPRSKHAPPPLALRDGVVRHSASSDQIRAALQEASERASRGSLIIVYISTHGFTDPDQGPHFVAENGDWRTLAGCIAVGDVNKILDQSDATQRLIIVDACRSVADRTRAGDSDISFAMNRQFRTALGGPDAQVVLSSCSIGQFSYEPGPGGLRIPGDRYPPPTSHGVYQGQRTLNPLCHKDLHQEAIVPPANPTLPYDAVL